MATTRYDALLAERDKLTADGEAVFKAAEAEGRDLTDEERGKIDAINARRKVVSGDIDREAERRAAAIEASRNTPEEPRITGGHNRAADKPWSGFGEFLQAVARAEGPGAQIDPRLTYRAAASGANESVASDGGYLVQQDFSSELLRRAYQTGQVMSRARHIPISSGANGLKINGINETSRANGSRWGGVQAYWAAEADTVTASRPRFRQIELTLNKLMAIFYATDELVADAAALESVGMQAFSEEFGFKLDDAGLRGAGAGQPLGILNCPALVSVAKETGQAAATIVVENLVKMWARMWGPSRQNAVWFYNQDVEPQLFTMGLIVGTGGAPIYMPPGGLSASPYGTLFGRPMIPIEQCSTLGTVGDIILADMSQYIVAEKGGMQSASSLHVRFLYDEATYRFTLRVDGQPLWQSALTPAQGSNTLSPFVALATRS
ncbi:MAG: phage major capsid protein [Chloroflexi bacterium]|nr:phage major capsid protein [Chloroflexota bacterium]